MSKLLEDVRNIHVELAVYINPPSWNRPTFFFDNDEEDSILYKEYLEKSSNVITTVLPTEEPEYSLSIAYEHLSTIQKTESDELIECSAKNLLPILSEYEVTSDDESECDVPVKDESSLVFTTFLNPLFDDDDDFTSSDDESLFDEEVPIEDFKVYSNPLFDDDEIKYDKLDPHCFNAKSDFVESLFNRDTLFDFSPKFDYLKEFSGELMPTTINLCPHPLENFQSNTIVETLPTSPIPVKDGDSQKEEIDIFTGTDELLPSSIESDDYDLERDVHFLEELLVNDSISLPENKSFYFDHHDDSLFPRPPSEPLDVEFFFEPNLGEVIAAVMNNNDELNEDECFDPTGKDYAKTIKKQSKPGLKSQSSSIWTPVKIPHKVLHKLTTIVVMGVLRDNMLLAFVPLEITRIPDLANVSLQNNKLQVSTLIEIAGELGYPLSLAESWKGNDADYFAGIWEFNSLRSISLDGNNLVGPIPKVLTSLKDLQLLDVSRNNLSGIVPAFSPKVKFVYDNNLFLGVNISNISPPPGPVSNISASSGSLAKRLKRSSRSVGLVIGIVVSVLLFVGIMLFVSYKCYMKHKYQKFRRVESRKSGKKLVPESVLGSSSNRYGKEMVIKESVAGSNANRYGVFSELQSQSSGDHSEMHVFEVGNVMISSQVLRQVTNNFNEANVLGRVDLESFTKVVQIILWYLDSGCSKHMTGNCSRLNNFMKNFIGIIIFKNDHFGAIMGYGDYVVGDSVISRVYYVEGRRHNLFSVGQFCDSDLKVAFRKHSCYVRDVDGVELLNGNRGSNLYTISIEYIMKSFPICLLSKASKNKSWLWHHRLNHLNFGTINDLAREDLVRGLPRLKFEKYHLCFARQLGKSKKYTHKSKSKNTIMEDLHTLHMDLCRPMRVDSINGKRYILVIIDDYSRFTLVMFLRSKDETPKFVIKFLKQIQVCLNKTVRFIQTDNGT
nr:receptor-like kinase TMK4 [Tanacetum cinerariifolium]